MNNWDQRSGSPESHSSNATWCRSAYISKEVRYCGKGMKDFLQNDWLGKENSVLQKLRFPFYKERFPFYILSHLQMTGSFYLYCYIYRTLQKFGGFSEFMDSSCLKDYLLARGLKLHSTLKTEVMKNPSHGRMCTPVTFLVSCSWGSSRCCGRNICGGQKSYYKFICHFYYV